MPSPQLGARTQVFVMPVKPTVQPQSVQHEPAVSPESHRPSPQRAPIDPPSSVPPPSSPPTAQHMLAVQMEPSQQSLVSAHARPDDRHVLGGAEQAPINANSNNARGSLLLWQIFGRIKCMRFLLLTGFWWLEGAASAVGAERLVDVCD